MSFENRYSSRNFYQQYSAQYNSDIIDFKIYMTKQMKYIEIKKLTNILKTIYVIYGDL